MQRTPSASAGGRDLVELNQRLSRHMGIIERCSIVSPKHGRLLLATPPGARYPYVYPRDCSCACQLFRRLACSSNDYDCAPQAFDLLQSTAAFLRDVQEEDGCWGQRYTIEGKSRSIYRQEDNIAHGVSIICNYLLAASGLGKPVSDLDAYLQAINRALSFAVQYVYQRELNLFESTTSIHESALETGYTLWVNFSYLYAFSLADEVNRELDGGDLIDRQHLDFRAHFLYSVRELFMTGQRYVRRIEPGGRFDLRPDFTLLSPFYYGFVEDEDELRRGVEYLESQLCDPELNMIMRYLPFRQDFATHIHAGNGPWLQYSAILAQYHYWSGNRQRGDELLEMIDRYRNEKGEIPEHLSTCKRFEEFMEKEWRTGTDFAKEFDAEILLDGLPFDLILEEANNMQRSYEETASRCMFMDGSAAGGGYIQFATPLMWSHAEYARALLVRAEDWWKAR